MRIVFAGTPEFAVPSLRALVSAGHDVVGVITRNDAPLGRKRVLTPSAIALAAAELGLNTLKANRLGDRETDWVRRLDPELGVIVAYGALVRDPLLDVPGHGWINLHFSDLPAWRGAAPVQRALIAGQQELGVSVFRLVAELDAGDVLSRDSHDFPEGTTAGEALTTLAEFGISALLRAVQTLETNPGAGAPQEGEASYAHKLARADGKLDPQRPVAQLLAHWSGVTPEPGAFVLHEGRPLKLIEVAKTPTGVESGLLAPGEVVLHGGRAVLNLVDGQLELIRVQPAGKPAMSGVSWLRGRAVGDAKVVLS